jgi:hypothetical protein
VITRITKVDASFVVSCGPFFIVAKKSLLFLCVNESPKMVIRMSNKAYLFFAFTGYKSHKISMYNNQSVRESHNDATYITEEPH